MPIRTLIIDNYDSYTFNLIRLFPDPSYVVIIRNDQFTWPQFVSTVLPHFDNVVISPGPGRPEHPNDFGLCIPLLQAQRHGPDHLKIPIFGVCLGYQGIAHIFGGKIEYAHRIMHGRMSQIIRTEQEPSGDVLDHLPVPFWAVRYHSLVADAESLPSCLKVTAYCYEYDADIEALENAHYVGDQGELVHGLCNDPANVIPHPPLRNDETKDSRNKTVMAFRHESLPIWGVQFHPESICTEYGTRMVANFSSLTLDWMAKIGREIRNVAIPSNILKLSVIADAKMDKEATNGIHNSHELQILPVDIEHLLVNSGDLFEEIIARNQIKQIPITWLDSAMKKSPYSKFSTLSVDPAFTIGYSTLHREVTITMGTSSVREYLRGNETFYDRVSSIMSNFNSLPQKVIDEGGDSALDSLPFRGGLVGYFGYEMKRESLAGYHVPKEQECQCQMHGPGSTSKHNCCPCQEVPDAAFHFVDKYFAFDVKERCIYVCCLVQHGQSNIPHVGLSEQAALSWMRSSKELVLSIAEKLSQHQKETNCISQTPASSRLPTPPDSKPILEDSIFEPDTTHSNYIDSITKCIEQIREGESYELCLTTQFRHALDKDIAANACDPQLTKLYTKHLRLNNPAPFSAALCFPTFQMSLMGSSPERFLKIDDNGIVEMKPIKGTVKRCLTCVCDQYPGIECDMDEECARRTALEDQKRMQALWSDVKERAENLMIVDLIRNDMAQFCEPKTVSVPKFIHVETYEKVHHLVSTVCAQLRQDIDSVRAVQDSFPPGSMTGAPKLRSVQILDKLECHIPRNVYSGCLGYFSAGDARSATGKVTAEFSVVIRTAIASTKPSHVELSIGAGGAITFLSDPENEWHEVLLKTKSVAPSVEEYVENA
ncbi:ADC synthase [Umbelopsis sp. PMI_123]|nr:ADC synthase [Umbelopsis sp. PMI_123]